MSISHMEPDPKRLVRYERNSPLTHRITDLRNTGAFERTAAHLEMFFALAWVLGGVILVVFVLPSWGIIPATIIGLTGMIYSYKKADRLLDSSRQALRDADKFENGVSQGLVVATLKTRNDKGATEYTIVLRGYNCHNQLCDAARTVETYQDWFSYEIGMYADFRVSDENRILDAIQS